MTPTMSMNTAARFELFDHPEVKLTVIDGVTHIGDPDRDIVQEFGFIEPRDARTDMCVSVPVRSALQYGDPTFEIGSLGLDGRECVDLYNALADHINTFRLAKAVSA